MYHSEKEKSDAFVPFGRATEPEIRQQKKYPQRLIGPNLAKKRQILFLLHASALIDARNMENRVFDVDCKRLISATHSPARLRS